MGKEKGGGNRAGEEGGEKGKRSMGIEFEHREDQGKKWTDYMLGNDWNKAFDEQWNIIYEHFQGHSTYNIIQGAKASV